MITEFKSAPISQRTPFFAEVEFFSIEEIRAMLQEHYANYYRFYVKRSKTIDEEELRELESTATTAKDIFQALFAAHPEFESFQSSTMFLNSGESKQDIKMLRKLSEWASEMIRRQCGEAETVSFTASTAEDLSCMLEPYIEMRSRLDGEEFGSASYWPLVRLVTVSLKSRLLARGLVIADLPGLHKRHESPAKINSNGLK